MLATISTLSSLKSRANKITPLTTIIDTDISGCFSVAQDTTGNIWAISNAANAVKSLIQINPNNNYSYLTIAITTSATKIKNIFIDGNNNLLFNNENGNIAISNFITKLGANAVTSTSFVTQSASDPVLLDSLGNAYLYSGGIIYKYVFSTFGSSTGMTSSIFAGGNAKYYDDVLATATQLNQPNIITQWTIYNGYFYMADRNNNVIRRINMSTNIISLVAGTPPVNGTTAVFQGSSGDGGPATSCRFYWPSGIAFDSAGNLYISDYGNNKIRVVNTSGIISTLVAVTQPWQLLVDVNNNLIIAANTKLYSYPLS